MVSETIPEGTRKEIFEAVVRGQDLAMARGESPGDIRNQVAEEYGVSADVVREIEDEGIDKAWPPLDPCEDE